MWTSLASPMARHGDRPEPEHGGPGIGGARPRLPGAPAVARFRRRDGRPPGAQVYLVFRFGPTLEPPAGPPPAPRPPPRVFVPGSPPPRPPGPMPPRPIVPTPPALLPTLALAPELPDPAVVPSSLPALALGDGVLDRGLTGADVIRPVWAPGSAPRVDTVLPSRRVLVMVPVRASVRVLCAEAVPASRGTSRAARASSLVCLGNRCLRDEMPGGTHA